MVGICLRFEVELGGIQVSVVSGSTQRQAAPLGSESASDTKPAIPQRARNHSQRLSSAKLTPMRATNYRNCLQPNARGARFRDCVAKDEEIRSPRMCMRAICRLATLQKIYQSP